MQNYILNYQLRDNNSMKELLNQMKNKYPKSRVITESDEKYFLFSARELPGVKDELQKIMDILNLNDSDYIALYYTREEEPDEINRLMIFGPSSLVENKNTSKTTLERILGELLEYDFIKPKK